MKNCIRFPVILLFTIKYFLFAQAAECREGRILGGKPTQPHDFKYVVFIYHQDVPGSCTGGILSKDLIVTAAHCIVNKTTNEFKKGRIRVIAGTNEILQSDAGNGFLVKDIMVPRNYNERTRSEGDIGLLRLAQPLSRNLEKLFLPKTDLRYSANKVFIFAGFGFSEVVDYKNGTYVYPKREDAKLLQTDMKLSENCDGKFFNRPIPKDAFCAKMAIDEKLNPVGICKGDSGGPLVDSNKIVIGIASYGHKGCNEKIKPTVFTKMYRYVNVIADAINGSLIGRFKKANESGYF